MGKKGAVGKGCNVRSMEGVWKPREDARTLDGKLWQEKGEKQMESETRVEQKPINSLKELGLDSNGGKELNMNSDSK